MNLPKKKKVSINNDYNKRRNRSRKRNSIYLKDLKTDKLAMFLHMR